MSQHLKLLVAVRAWMADVVQEPITEAEWAVFDAVADIDGKPRPERKRPFHARQRSPRGRAIWNLLSTVAGYEAMLLRVLDDLPWYCFDLRHKVRRELTAVGLKNVRDRFGTQSTEFLDLLGKWFGGHWWDTDLVKEHKAVMKDEWTL